MSTALTLYGVPAFATTLPSATQSLANTSGAASTGHDTSIGSNTGYGELYPQGNAGAWPALGSLPAGPSGNGFLFDDTSLEWRTLAAGTWMPTLRLRVNGGVGGITADLYVRAYKRSSSGVYTLIGVMSLLAQSIANGTSANYTLAATGLSAMPFAAGDKLYYGIWVNITTPASGAANLRMDISSSTSQGSINCQLVTPGYDVMPPLAAVVGSSSVPIMQNPQVGGVPTFDQRVDDRATGSFVIYDEAIGYNLAEDQAVVAADTVAGVTLYTGFIDKIDDQLIKDASVVRNQRTVTLKDLRWLAEKRIAPSDFPGWTAGDIAAELHRTTLAAEGITASYAMRHDMDATSFGAGTLSGVIANPTTGYLELAKAGTSWTKVETSTTDFGTGTLSNVAAGGSQLTLTSYQAIKLSGTSGKSVGFNGGNLFTYWAIWVGSQSVATDDYLEFDIWISSTSVEISGGVDLICSDGTTFRDSGAFDQFGIDCHPKASLAGYANDQWMHRVITVPASWNGKTIKVCRVAFESDMEGAHTLYVKEINFRSSGGTLKTAFFSSSLQKASQSSNVGYLNVTLTKVTAYAQVGSRISPAYGSISATIAGNSLITWNQSIPTQPTTQGAATMPTPLTIKSSLDGGASWQLCTNHAAIPSLLIGQNLSGKTLMLRETFNVAGPNPELPPVLSDVTLSIDPAYAATKTDVLHADAASAMTTGTIVNSGYQAAFDPAHDLSGYVLAGKRKRWNWAQFGDTTTFGSFLVRGVSYGSLYLRADPSTDCRLRFDGPTYSSVALEVDVQAPNIGANTGGTGVLYRTTNWDNNANTFGYSVYINQSQLVLGRGTNSGTSTWTTLATVTVNLTIGDWYHLKVVCGSDNIHHVFLDDVEYITVTDSTFTAAGQVGLRFWNNTGGQLNGYFDNFGVSSSNTLTGSRIAPSVSISSVGTVETSAIWWNADIPPGCSLDIQASTDGGTTYVSCTNGGLIPGCEVGVNVAGKSLLIKTVLTTGSLSLTPILYGLSWLVVGNFAAAGSRISPVLDATPAGVVGSSSVTWQAVTPVGTAAFVDSSTDGSTWTNVPTSGGAVAGLTPQGALWWDTFDSNSSASYTYTAASWLWDIANSRLATSLAISMYVPRTFGGTYLLSIPSPTYTDLLLSGLSVADVEVMLITNQVQDMAILLRQAASNDRYTLPISDNSGLYGGIIDLHRVTPGGGDVLIAHGSINFVRGTYHVIRVTLTGSTFNVYFDGVLLYTYTDATPITHAGSVGLNRGTGTSYINDLAIRPLGQPASGKSVYTKVRLTSSDPLQTPSVPDLLASVRSPDLSTGSVIPQTQHAYKDSVAAFLDDVAKQSNLSWRFNESFQMKMTDRLGQFAPFVIATVNGNIDGVTPPTVTHFSPLYRNRQYITGAIDLATVTEPKIGDGVTQSWSLSYPVETMQTIMLNGEAQSFGIQGTDTGRAFYYQQGSNTLTIDASLTPPASTFMITYTGQVPYRAMAQDTSQQAVIAALDHSTGIVEMSEDAPGLLRAAADALAASRITQYARLALDWKFVTRQSGLGPGQLLTVVVPQHALNDLQFLITDVSAAVAADTNGTLLYWYTVSTTTGPSLGNWSRKLQTALLTKG